MEHLPEGPPHVGSNALLWDSLLACLPISSGLHIFQALGARSSRNPPVNDLMAAPPSLQSCDVVPVASRTEVVLSSEVSQVDSFPRGAGKLSPGLS